jgi:hypothetical protein
LKDLLSNDGRTRRDSDAVLEIFDFKGQAAFASQGFDVYLIWSAISLGTNNF